MSHEDRELTADGGSFRDRSNRVYSDGTHVFRGIDLDLLEAYETFSNTRFFQDFHDAGKVVATKLLDRRPDEAPRSWAAFLEHEKIPFVSYPYEWSFGMLKDAALLQLELITRALPEGWTHKDASAYNIQWQGSHPVFIDVPSFTAYQDGEPWVGYRQFCMMFLYPLMLKAYKGLSFRPFLRSHLEGIEPTQADLLLTGFDRLKKGVLGHVYLHAKMQRRHDGADINEARELTEHSTQTIKKKTSVKHSQAMVLGTLESLQRIVRGLNISSTQTVWGDYDRDHSYADDSFQLKRDFVTKHAAGERRNLVWDLGCNTGTFSKICAQHSRYVVAADGDERAIERLYQALKTDNTDNILPLVIDLANPSPNQGWRGLERKAFDARDQPDLILCLALIHHLVISANIPLKEFVSWLRQRHADVIIEFVSNEDDMVKMMMRNRVNQYAELTESRFEQMITESFSIIDRQPLKGGHRTLYFLTPS